MHRPIHTGPRRRTRRALLAVVLPAALALAALPAAAQAAADVTSVGTEIVVEDNTGRFSDNNRLVAESLPGGELRLVDQVGLVASASGCFQISQLEVRCVRPASSPISRLVVRGGGGNDRLTMLGSLPARYEGGTGDDAYVGATRPGVPTAVDFSGGGDPGDLADYSRAEQGIDVRKNDLPNDGRTSVGDKDNIRQDVTIVRGTRFRDSLHGQNRLGGSETLEPQGGDDVVLGISGITVVDMGAAPDGADKILGSSTIVSYAKRTKPIRAAVDLDGADDGEAGERDELRRVGSVTGGSAGDTLLTRLNRIDGVGIGFNGGPGVDIISGTDGRDFLTGGPGTDTLKAFGSEDQLFSNDSEPGDRLFCGAGFDRATTDAVEATVSDCERRTDVGTLRLAPTRLQAKAGETAHLRLSWRHPQSWRKLRAIELRLLSQAGEPVGEVTVRPRAERISDRGAVEVMRKRTRLTRKGKTVTARLALRLDKALVGQSLRAEVQATDTRGHRQLQREAGTVRIAG